MTKSELGERELDLLQALWEIDEPATVAEVHARVERRGVRVAYNTVQTMLNRLEGKELVRRDTTGRAHHYTAVVGEDRIAESALGRIVSRFFGGSAERLAAHLLEEDLDEDEVARLERRIRERRREVEP